MHFMSGKPTRCTAIASGLLACMFAAIGAAADPPEAKPLWPQGAPGAMGEQEADIPTLRHYPPEGKTSGAAVIICPGGGYSRR